jgi:hypothetical protein
MLNRTFLAAFLASLSTFLLITASLLLFSHSLAAPAQQNNFPTELSSGVVSVSALAFLPTQPLTPYAKDAAQQWLKLEALGLLTAVAPLNLPEGAGVNNLTTHGVYVGANNLPSGQYQAQILLKRCPLNGQTACEALIQADLRASAVTGQSLNWSQPVSVAIDNQSFTYFLEFNTQDPGSALRAVQLQLGEAVAPPNPAPPAPAAVNAVIQDLSRLGIPANQINVTFIQANTWPDANLGCPRSGTVGIQVPVAGYLIILEAQGRTYRYHTDQTGSALVLCQ